MECIEIFSGFGGLAMGLEKAGFSHSVLAESNQAAQALLPHLFHASILGDVRSIDWMVWRGRISVVAGGPPCQPFSKAGLGRGAEDNRDMWKEALRCVAEVRPEAFAFENVPGLLLQKHKTYLDGLIEAFKKLDYHVQIVRRNAADHGAAQDRERVFILGRLGGREDIPFPSTSHSRDALLRVLSNGSYADKHGLKMEDLSLPARLPRTWNGECGKKPWLTVRDALVGLGEPNGVNRHDYVEGAKEYKGHLGSPWDWVAKTLKAGVHGIPGGENMVKFRDGRVRYFTVREAARLTGFPDNIEFKMSRTQAIKGLGNAVPIPLAQAVGQWLSKAIISG